MLEEKLRQASETTAKYRKRTVLMLGAALLFCTAFIVILSFIHMTPSRSDSGKMLSANTHHPTETPELRQQFMQQMQVYEEELEPDIAAANLKSWNLKKEADITSLKGNAISAFAKADYATALKHLSGLETMARQTLTERDALFSAEMAMARQALGEDHYIAGKLHITKALLLKQNDQEAHGLKKQIEFLPALVALLQDADIARTENNPEKEYAALAKAVKISPDRNDLKQRRDALAESIRENQFSAFISRGLLSVEKKDISMARLNYKKARVLYSGRSELRILHNAIVKASNALDLETALAQARKAITRDDWIRAQSVYAGSSKRHPDDTAIVHGLQLANRMVNLQHSVTDYIRRPERLSSRNIFAHARLTLKQAGAYVRYSKSLTRKLAELKALLAAMNVKVPVFVKSDNQTYILVRGVGKVGTTAGRTIQLRPGDYIFEGIRSGYKSKLVQVRIPVGEASFQVEVVCDERI